MKPRALRYGTDQETVRAERGGVGYYVSKDLLRPFSGP